MISGISTNSDTEEHLSKDWKEKIAFNPSMSFLAILLGMLRLHGCRDVRLVLPVLQLATVW